MASAPGVQANKMPFFRRYSLKNAPMPPIYRIGPNYRKLFHNVAWLVQIQYSNIQDWLVEAKQVSQKPFPQKNMNWSCQSSPKKQIENQINIKNVIFVLALVC